MAKRTVRRAKKTMRRMKKTMRKKSKYTKKKRGTKKKKGKRKLSSWNKKVAMVFKDLKKKNPNATLGDAMKAASKQKKSLSIISVDGGGKCGKTSKY